MTENSVQRDRAADTANAKPGMSERIAAKLESMSGEATRVGPSGRNPRRARLRLTRIDPWSVMKLAFLLALAFAVVTIVAVFMVWTVLGAAGVWDSINQTVRDIVGGQDASSFDVTDYVGTGRVLGFTFIVSAVNVVLITAVATLSAFLYNMAAALLGGVEVTLAEEH